jgi:N-acetylglucosaminyldiphosphoundecaprenol N-acetyl-beta-D-mannosaminyltransferase
VRYPGKRNLLGVLVDAVDEYDPVVDRIVAAAKEGRGFGVSALAVHGVMSAVADEALRYRINHLDLVTPDGQPVRWALNALYGAGLRDRVYGPRLMLHVCQAAASEGLPVFLYGSTHGVLSKLAANLRQGFPGLELAGTEPSRFRRTGPRERAEIASRIRNSGAKLTMVGLGCPRQEVFAHAYRDVLAMPVVAVGAAFDYHSGSLREPPAAIQRAGLQWLHRLLQEPQRLWKRYLLLNPKYMWMVTLQALGLWAPDLGGTEPPVEELMWG